MLVSAAILCTIIALQKCTFSNRWRRRHKAGVCTVFVLATRSNMGCAQSLFPRGYCNNQRQDLPEHSESQTIGDSIKVRWKHCLQCHRPGGKEIKRSRSGVHALTSPMLVTSMGPCPTHINTQQHRTTHTRTRLVCVCVCVCLCRVCVYVCLCVWHVSVCVCLCRAPEMNAHVGSALGVAVGLAVCHIHITHLHDMIFVCGCGRGSIYIYTRRQRAWRCGRGGR